MKDKIKRVILFTAPYIPLTVLQAMKLSQKLANIGRWM